MSRFLERYLKHPEKGTERYLDQSRSYIITLTNGRDFGESINGFLDRNPDVKDGMKSTHEDIICLGSISGYNTIEELYKMEREAYQQSAFSYSIDLRKVIAIRCEKEGLKMWIDKNPYLPKSHPKIIDSDKAQAEKLNQCLKMSDKTNEREIIEA